MKQIRLLIFLCCFLPQVNYAQKFFNTTEDYLKYVLENTDFEKDKVFVNDFISNENFIDDVVVGELFTFYGVAYQSELYSASQLDLPGCWGQFLSLCKSLKEGDEDI